MIPQNTPIHFYALVFQSIVSNWCFWKRIYTDILPVLFWITKTVSLSIGVWECPSCTRSDDNDGNENVRKAKGSISNITTLHIYLPFFHDYDVKLPNFMFCEGLGLRLSYEIVFLFLNLDKVPRRRFACSRRPRILRFQAFMMRFWRHVIAVTKNVWVRTPRSAHLSLPYKEMGIVTSY